MSSVPHTIPSRMAHTVAALYGHADDTLLAWQQACVHAAETLQPPPDPERLAKALALAQDGAVILESDGAALVTSGGTRYHLDADGVCHCPDVRHRGALCKHQLAMQIHQQATASLAPSTSGVARPTATAQPAPAPDTRQGRPPSAERWDVKEAPASACVRLRVGELEILYTMRDITDAELTSRVQHLVPWVQDLLAQARERQVHLDALRQQRDAAPTPPAVPPLPPPTVPPTSIPTDLRALLQQAVQQVLAAHAPSTASANGQAPDMPPPAPPHHGAANGASAPDDQQTGFCSIHQVQMAQKSNARGTWYSHWLRGEQQHCKGRRNGRR